MIDVGLLAPSDVLANAYAVSLVPATIVTSMVLPILTAAVGFETMRRLGGSRARHHWFAMATLLLGAGLWVGNFLGLLAMRIATPVSYDIGISALSLLAALLCSALIVYAHELRGRGLLRFIPLTIAATLCLGASHYVGVAALRLDAVVRFEPVGIVISLIVAGILVYPAMVLLPSTDFTRAGLRHLRPSLLGALCVGAADTALHYFAINTTHFIHVGGDNPLPAASAVLLALTAGGGVLALSAAGALVMALGTRVRNVQGLIDRLLTTMSKGYLLIDDRGIVAGHNPGMSALLGTPGANLLGWPVSEIFGELTPAMRTAAGDERSLRRPDGSRVPCLVHADTIADPSNHRVLSYALFTDISARIEIEAGLRASQQQFSALLDSTPDPMIIVDSGGLITMVNRKAEQFFATSRADMLRTPAERWLPFGAQRSLYKHTSGLGDEATIQMASPATILHAVTGNGDRVPVEVSFAPIETTAGVVVASTLRDVSERLQAARELDTQMRLQRGSQEALRVLIDEQRAIFESASMGIAFIRTGVVVRCNSRLEKEFGAKSHAMLGRPFRAWFPTEDASQDTLRLIDSALAAGEALEHETSLQRVDSSRFTARMRVQAIAAHDQALGFVVVVEDIGQERRATEDLRAAKEMAEEAARTKSQFLANMSHEIRTPMNAIIGMSHLLAKTGLSDRQAEFVGKVQQASAHLLGIINDILDLSKIEAGKLHVERVEFGIDAVLDRVTTLVAREAHAKHLELLITVDPAVPARMVGDPGRLGQVLINYLNNAVKFTDRGDIRLSVTVAKDEEHGCMLRFEVRDTGIGLNEAQRSRLFQTFQQADASTTRRYGGTGLGLSISKYLAEMMGGTVGVESELGTGSLFWFTAYLGHTQVPARVDPRLADLAGRRVLVLDDHPRALAIAVGLVEQLKMAAHGTGSGAEALALIQRAAADGQPIDFVLFDLPKSGANGTDIVLRIRALALQPMPRIVLVSADAWPDDRKHPGVDAIVSKPLTPSLLLDALGGRDGSALLTRSASDGHTIPDLRGVRVLLADDQPINQDVAVELLREAGCEPVVVADGAAALAMIARQAFDVVLMDVHMPVMDGLEATRRLRAMRGYEHLPILAMTANAMASDREECLAAGMNDHIPKPIEPFELWSQVAHWSGRAASATNAISRSAADLVSGAEATVPSLAGLETAPAIERMMGRTDLYQTRSESTRLNSSH